MGAVQVVDDRDVAAAIATRRQHAPGPVLREDRLRGTELLEDRGPAIDAAARLALARIGHRHERRMARADVGRGARTAAQVLGPRRTLPLRVGQHEIECAGVVLQAWLLLLFDGAARSRTHAPSWVLSSCLQWPEHAFAGDAKQAHPQAPASESRERERQATRSASNAPG